jgi:hypothetical protein
MIGVKCVAGREPLPAVLMSVAAVFNDSEMLARMAAIGGAKLIGEKCQTEGIGLQCFSSFAAGTVMINTRLTTMDVMIGKDKRLTNPASPSEAT